MVIKVGLAASFKNVQDWKGYGRKEAKRGV
jgi:hypothetical protein